MKKLVSVARKMEVKVNKIKSKITDLRSEISSINDDIKVEETAIAGLKAPFAIAKRQTKIDAMKENIAPIEVRITALEEEIALIEANQNDRQEQLGAVANFPLPKETPPLPVIDGDSLYFKVNQKLTIPADHAIFSLLKELLPYEVKKRHLTQEQIKAFKAAKKDYMTIEKSPERLILSAASRRINFLFNIRKQMVLEESELKRFSMESEAFGTLLIESEYKARSYKNLVKDAFRFDALSELEYADSLCFNDLDRTILYLASKTMVADLKRIKGEEHEERRKQIEEERRKKKLNS